jgi:pimeloyl-ACP methyl ester carboxylesterase
MKLSAYTFGSGPRHVGLVHGLGGNADTWTPLIDRMLASGQYTVTAVDLRGHGTSARAGSTGAAADRAEYYSVDELANDVVENLPQNLDSVVGHSLGGAVLARAVDRLAPKRAIYLDPGFFLALPTTGLRGRLFWLAPLVSLGIASVKQAQDGAKVKAKYPAEVRESLDHAERQFDKRMALGVFRDVAFHPVPAVAPSIPSTIVLSDDSPAILREREILSYQSTGWDIRRLPGIHHDMQLEDPHRVFAAIRDVL